MSENQDILALRAFLKTGVPVAVESNEFLVALGTRFLGYDFQSGTLTLEYSPSAMFLQGGGAVQGGILAGMLDFAMAFATFAAIGDGKTASTVALFAQNAAAARGGTLIATGTVEKAGRRIVSASARLHEGERLIATGSSTLAVSDAPRPA